MWIDKDIIPALIDAVEKTIKSELEAFDEAEFNQDEHFDGNDLVILDSFVLHTLRENIGCGFYSSAMLNKGFGFMMGLVRLYINEHGHSLPAISLGKLAKLHYEYYLKEAISYLGYIEAEHVQENLTNIDRYINQAMIEYKFLNQQPLPIPEHELTDTKQNNIVSLKLVSENGEQCE